jgi:hypothetical protein
VVIKAEGLRSAVIGARDANALEFHLDLFEIEVGALVGEGGLGWVLVIEGRDVAEDIVGRRIRDSRSGKGGKRPGWTTRNVEGSGVEKLQLLLETLEAAIYVELEKVRGRGHEIVGRVKREKLEVEVRFGIIEVLKRLRGGLERGEVRHCWRGAAGADNMESLRVRMSW